MKKILLLILILLFQLNFAQSDCNGAITVCGNSSISYTPSGFATQEINSSNTACGFWEVNSVWYTFTVATAGTLTFQITPNVTTNDYDFYLFGPNVTCGNLGTSIRCSVAVPSGGLTGLNMTSTVAADPVGGTGFAQYLDVLPGQTYYLCVNNFSPVTEGFSLTWGGTATLASPFNNATLTPNPFIAPGPNHDGNVIICTSPANFDFSTLSTGIINGNANFSVTYHNTANDVLTNSAPITSPISVNTTNTYYYAIRYTDPTNPNNPINRCFNTGTIKFVLGNIPVNNTTVFACNNNNTGIGTFDLSNTAAAIFTDPTATIKYYPTMADVTANTNQILNLNSYVSPPKQIFALVTTTQGCTNVATVTLALSPLLPVTPATLTACNNNNSGVGLFDLTTAVVYTNPNAPKKYYPTLANLLNGTNQITNPQSFMSGGGNVYVEVTGAQGCKNYTTINLQFYPVVVTKDATISSCFIEGTPTMASFDLNTAIVSTQSGVTKKFYPTLQDAINGTNQIMTTSNFISTNASVYVRVTETNGCWGTAKITLSVIPPTYSTVLKDKIICIENKTTLDAGAGFSAYLWSTGATTQSITNVSVGEYWVDLKTENCITRQKVKVVKSADPVITNIEISNSTITIAVSGGNPPYKYSLDGVKWQNSNTFTGLPRGQNTIYVKDNYDCNPIITEITVPNLVNAITPNGDNVNDVVDYSALSYKKDVILNIYDRYGNKLFQADKTNGYKWDGRASGKKVYTGTYWYSITWTEPATNIPVKYTGWIMVKNRD